MRQVESTYIQFPVAIEWPEIKDPERAAARSERLLEWKEALGLDYQSAFICIEGRPIGGHRRERVTAYAFKSKALALQFKMIFASS